MEGERKSKLYNESAFLLSFRAMSAILRNPPLPFQLVIRYKPCANHPDPPVRSPPNTRVGLTNRARGRRYFADHAKAIVELCQPYLLEPVPIPTLAEGAPFVHHKRCVVVAAGLR